MTLLLSAPEACIILVKVWLNVLYKSQDMFFFVNGDCDLHFEGQLI